MPTPWHVRFLWIPGTLWAAPFSLLGLLIMLLTLSAPYGFRAPALVVRMGRPLRWLVGKVAPGFGMAAFTWGHFIFTWNDLRDRKGMGHAGDKRLVRHELVHVRQAMVFGPLFPLLYLGSMLVAWAQGKRPYRDSIFERQAYDAEVNP